MRFLDTYGPQIFAAARIAFGVLFVSHGFQKAFMMFGGPPAEMPDAARYLIGWMELVGEAMIAIGFKTRIAAFPHRVFLPSSFFSIMVLTNSGITKLSRTSSSSTRS